MDNTIEMEQQEDTEFTKFCNDIYNAMPAVEYFNPRKRSFDVAFGDNY